MLCVQVKDVDIPELMRPGCSGPSLFLSLLQEHFQCDESCVDVGKI